MEGRHEYTQLLYPGHAPFDMWDRQARHGIKLYVRRVFIMDDAEKLMPLYLRFVRGWSIPTTCRSTCRARSCRNPRTSIHPRRLHEEGAGLLEDLAENQEDKYADFWKEFGKC